MPYWRVGMKRVSVVRGICLVAAVVTVFVAREPAWLSRLVPALSPYNALLALLSGGAAWFMLGAVPIALIGVVVPRFFCRWICPTGSCQDAVACWRRSTPWLARVPRVGWVVTTFGVGAALVGAPVVGWLDPLAIFNAAAGVLRKHLELNDWLAAAGLPLLLLLTLVAPGLWCARLCPLGALQEMLATPLQLWRRRAAVVPQAEGAAIGRRAFLGLGLGAGTAPLLRAPVSGSVIRPPLADHQRFSRLCTRCGACVRNCPGNIIKFGGDANGWAGVLAPEVEFAYGYCPPTCVRCGEVCPSGAIPAFNIRTKTARPMGVAVVTHDNCLLSESRECFLCVGACEYRALDTVWDEDEMFSHVVVTPERCVGCGGCEYVCPAEKLAIKVVPVSLKV